MFVRRVLSGMVLSVLDVLQDSFMPAAAAIVPKELSSTVLNVLSEPVIDASVSPTPTGTAPTVSASLASPQAVTPASAMALSSATTVNDAPPNLTLYGPTGSANVIMDMST